MPTFLSNYEEREPQAERDRAELSSPVQALADASLFVLVLFSLAIVLIGMLLGPISGLVAPEL